MPRARKIKILGYLVDSNRLCILPVIELKEVSQYCNSYSYYAINATGKMEVRITEAAKSAFCVDLAECIKKMEQVINEKLKNY